MNRFPPAFCHGADPPFYQSRPFASLFTFSPVPCTQLASGASDPVFGPTPPYMLSYLDALHLCLRNYPTQPATILTPCMPPSLHLILPESILRTQTHRNPTRIYGKNSKTSRNPGKEHEEIPPESKPSNTNTERHLTRIY